MHQLPRTALAIVAGGLLLAACGSTAPAPATLDGVASVSVSVPLSAVGCTTNDTCYAVGTTGVDTTVTTAAQYNVKGGAWHALVAPSAPYGTLTTSSCWRDGCLFGGSGPTGGDLVWSVTGTSHFTTVSAPTNGAGVTDISCYGEGTCAVLDVSGTGVARLSTTADAGASWDAPRVLTAASIPFTATSLSCLSSLNCVVAVHLTSSNTSVVDITEDGGGSWTQTSSGAWSNIDDLHCAQSWCVARATPTTGADAVVTSNTDGTSWSSPVTPNGHAVTNIACAALHHCVAVQSTGVAVRSGSHWTSFQLHYVPGPLVSVSCGHRWCAAVSAQSALSIPL